MPADRYDNFDLHDLARQALLERGLLPDFPPETEAELARMAGTPIDQGLVDMRSLPWCSIDNDDSRDLDQLTVAERLDHDAIRIFVAVADVDCLVKRGSAIDRHAANNTTSIYTAGGIFPMLPQRLSTDLTSLNPGRDRQAMVAQIDVDRTGAVTQERLYRALVHNHAQLAYDSVGAWLEEQGPLPERAAAVPALAEQLRMQDEAAQLLRERRDERGALELDTGETRPVMQDGRVVDLRRDEKNRAKQLIEDFMIAANGATARFLAKLGYSCIRRIVRAPDRWDRIVEVASRNGGRLPPTPDAKALERFLHERRRIDPLRFPDLSLSIVKLIGKGEYALERPGEATGHFGLALRDYTHSTAPNRRYPDLITQRLLKAAFTQAKSPYDEVDLDSLASHCTQQEDNATKVERRLRKSAAALLLRHRIGEHFDAIVTGAGEKGTWVRTFRPPVEGKVVEGQHGMDVGDQVRVKLVSVHVEQGFIDFAGVRR
jgi:exoribonuclease II